MLNWSIVTVPLHQFFRTVALVLPILSSFCLLSATDTVRPNVIILFIDDMGYADPSCFGNPLIETPSIDSLSEAGLMLTNFYVNSPICSASRTALSTGQYQQRWRINSFLNSRKANVNRRMAHFLEPSSYHTGQLFQDNGYSTAHFGKWHIGGGRDVGDAPLPSEYGFDESYVSFEGLGDRVIFNNGRNGEMSVELGRGKIDFAPKHETTEIYVDKAIDFINRNQSQPFYLELFTNDVHDPFLPKDGAADEYSKFSDNPEEQKFLAVLAELDRQIGRLLAHLDESRLAENTIVVFTSDNGPTDWKRYYDNGIKPPGFTGPYFGRKWSLFEGGIRMPFIVRWPGHVPAGVTDSKSVVAAFDMQRSLATLCGLELPDGKVYDGEDRASVFLGAPSARKEPIFWEYGVYPTIMPGTSEHQSPPLAMRDGNWKLLVNPDGSNPKLFNLKTDPSESKDLAESKPRKTQVMKDATFAWWSEMNEYFQNQ